MLLSTAYSAHENDQGDSSRRVSNPKTSRNHLVQAVTFAQAERDLVNVMSEYLRRHMNHEAKRLELDNLPTVRVARLLARDEFA